MDSEIRDIIARALEWDEAHCGYDRATGGLDPALRGRAPAGLPYTAWQLVEHLRITQSDILDFCRNPDHEERSWPDDYWPPAAAPPSDAAWIESLAAFTRDRAALQGLARDSGIDLAARIPHGEGQTYGRELLLAADHAAYHLGELVVVRRLLDAWPPPA